MTIRRLIPVAVLVLLVGLGYAGWRWFESGPAEAEAPASPPPAIPVSVATARRADVPIYLTGLGTVQAFNTVTVHSRVDGQLVKVAFVEGQDVKAGDLLVQIDPRPFQAQLDQAIAKQAQDEAQLANARLDLKRFQALAAKQYATGQSVDTQTALVNQLQATIKGDQAAIDNARVQLGYTTITSPINGRTGMRLVDEGNIVHATDPNGLVVITQLQPISVIFTIPEENLPAITREMAAGPLKVLAMSRDDRDQYGEGKLLLVDNVIDQTTGTIRLKAIFPNADLALWPGQFIDARLLLRVERNVVTVPSDAIERGAQGLYAYVVEPDSTVSVRQLKVGQISDSIAVIKDGIKEGERVVTAGQYRLQPGARVEIRTAAGQPQATGRAAMGEGRG